MIGPRASFPEAVWEEKSRGPRALIRVAGAWYAPPRAVGAPAWLAWVEPDAFDDSVRAAIARADSDGASALRVGGPPGNYLVSGAREPEVARFEAHGFTVTGSHVDLVVDPRTARASPHAITRDRDGSVCAWVEAVFGAAWAMEAKRAAAHDALFTARDDGGVLGFCAHSGNNAALGTFGPLGVASSSRGAGLGASLATAALHDLAAQGFTRVTVPWVSVATAAFYARTVTVVETIPRVTLSRPARTD